VAGVVDAGMYVFGGLDDRGNLGHRPLRDLWRLQASASAPYVQWERLENAPVASWGHAAVGYGRRLFVHGGSDITYASHQTIHEEPWQNEAADYEYLSGRLLQYDTVDRSWTVRPVLFASVSSGVCSVAGVRRTCGR
jgi:N-acetylneuraminic acid mutarotase